MEKIPCSVAMLTYNSAKTLRRALDSVKDFDDIILLDGGSTDETSSIAQEYGARIVAQDTKYNYPDSNRLADGGGARNQMMNAAKHDWYLWIDSDESISEGLHEEVARIVRAPYAEGQPLAYRVPIRIFIDGRRIEYSSNYPGYQFRFFNRKSGGRLTHKVHNRIEFNPGTIIGTLKSPWYVYVDSKDIKILGGIWKSYRRAEIEQAANRPFLDFMRHTIWFHLRASAGMAVKALYNYLRHGFRDTMPISSELARILSPLVLIVNATLFRFRKDPKSLKVS
jgi:glycosyltransferase involved in cell wall biosynthesis